MDCRTKDLRELDAQFAYLKPLVKQHVNACRSLDIPSSSTDADVMEAARGLK